MQLLSTDLSPYSARVRAQIYHKNLDIEIFEPDPPLKSEGFLSAYPLGKVPILLLEDGTALSESWAILNYLEDLYPENSLRPASALEKARMHQFKGFTDFLLKDSLFPLFVMLGGNPENRDPQEVIGNIKNEMSKFDRLLGEMTDCHKRSLHLGDIALATSHYFTIALGAVFGETDMFGDAKRFKAWWEWVQEKPAVTKAIGEMQQALKDRSG